MPYCKGTVLKIYPNELNFNIKSKIQGNPDYAIKLVLSVDGEQQRFQAGFSDYPNCYVGTIERPLRVGDTIGFMFEVDERTSNGKTYINNKLKKSTIELIESAPDDAPTSSLQQSNTGQQSQKSNGTGGSSAEPNPGAVGQVLNLAVYTGAIKDLAELNDKRVAAQVTKKVKDAKKALASVYNDPDSVLNAAQQDETNNMTTQQQQQGDNFPDDDIPF